RDFLHFTRGPDRHRELATPLQHDQAPRLNRIQTTSTRGVRARIRRLACATPTGFAGHAGATANLKLTFHLDHSAGADQLRIWASSRPTSLGKSYRHLPFWLRAGNRQNLAQAKYERRARQSTQGTCSYPHFAKSDFRKRCSILI